MTTLMRKHDLNKYGKSLFDEFNEIFQMDKNTFYKGTISPPTDIEEKKDSVLISLEVPGIKPDDISITIEKNTLIIKGEKKSELEDSNSSGYRRERVFGKFLRTFTLTEYVDSDKLTADYNAGVLKISLPKREAAKPKPVSINVRGA